MATLDSRCIVIQSRIRHLYHLEQGASNWTRKLGYRFLRWGSMLYHEYRKDEVGLRAESLSYFTLFSILPLLVGLFILFGFFGQWSPVQTELQLWIENLLEPIPLEYRSQLVEFVLQFKADYLQKLQNQSSTLGVFAVFVLIWIGAKVYFNIENLMNKVWGTTEPRGWLERIQNFVFVSVIAPLVATVVLTLPGVLSRFSGIELGFWFQQLLQDGLLLVGLVFVYRYFPNTRVKWKSAIWGAVIATVLFFISSLLLQIYFQFGTASTYGKLAVLPIFAFFIYVFWILFILGAEASYLAQNPHSFVSRQLPTGTFAECLLMVEMVRKFKTRFELGHAPQTLAAISKEFGVQSESIQRILDYLIRQKVVLVAQGGRQQGVEQYHLAKEIDEKNLISLIKDYLQLQELAQSFDVQSVIHAINTK